MKGFYSVKCDSLINNNLTSFIAREFRVHFISRRDELFFLTVALLLLLYYMSVTSFNSEREEVKQLREVCVLLNSGEQSVM